MCYFLIFMLCVLDLTTGFVSLPFFISVVATEMTGTANCIINNTLTQLITIPTVLSASTFSAMNFERYVSVLHPIFHRVQVTKKRLLICICILDVVLMIGLASWSNSIPIFQEIMVLLIIAFIITFVFAYTRIFLVARRSLHSRRGPGDRNTLANGNRKRLLKDLKLARTSFMVVFCFTLCFLPTPVISFAVNNENWYLKRAAFYWNISLVLSNSTLNSLIFFWAAPRLRKEAMKMLQNFLASVHSI